MMVWNTTMGGPCLLRPTQPHAWDSPATGRFKWGGCIDHVTEDGTCVPIDKSWCKKAYCDERGVMFGGMNNPKYKEYTGPWRFSMSTKEKNDRHAIGWNNQFGFPWEVGMMYNFTVGGDMQRAMGCEGLDEPFGTLPEADWPYRIATDDNPIWHSPVMKCNVNEYAPEGKELHQIIEDLASDNEYFAERFLEAWQMMTNNGYNNDELTDGPQSGWLGHFSLAQQGIDVGDFESYIAANAPVVFTDKNVDPWICGHRGHATTTCGIRYSKYFEIAENKYHQGSGCQFWPLPE